MLAQRTDKEFMHRAMQLAMLGQGFVSPNPMVGCIIVESGEIIGEGWHQKFGDAHAEVNAVKSVKDKSRLKNSTVYVTLEPCAHFGKTPPCADMLVAEGVKKVVIANGDPNPLVSGKGMEKLRNAGIEVVSEVLNREVRWMNRRFLNFFEKQRPYIILKWAETTDGFIARENYDSKWISDDYSRQLVHKWRSEEDAILVGANTARYDDPQLNVRDWSGRNPVRIVLDRFLKLPDGLNIMNSSQSTLLYNTIENETVSDLIKVKVDEHDFIRNMLADLHHRKIQSVLVEGGTQILAAFLSAGLWDEARVFISPVTFQKGITAPIISASPAMTEKLQADTLWVYYNS